ncbi:hypothetical protein [Streptomyces sp. NPDC001275]
MERITAALKATKGAAQAPFDLLLRVLSWCLNRRRRRKRPTVLNPALRNTLADPVAALEAEALFDSLQKSSAPGTSPLEALRDLDALEGEIGTRARALHDLYLEELEGGVEHSAQNGFPMWFMALVMSHATPPPQYMWQEHQEQVASMAPPPPALDDWRDLAGGISDVTFDVTDLNVAERNALAFETASVINTTLARLFLQLGPPPPGLGHEAAPASSGGGGTHR